MTRSDWAGAEELIKILEEADQEVPDELRDMKSRFESMKERREKERANFGGGGGRRYVITSLMIASNVNDKYLKYIFIYFQVRWLRRLQWRWRWWTRASILRMQFFQNFFLFLQLHFQLKKTKRL